MPLATGTSRCREPWTGSAATGPACRRAVCHQPAPREVGATGPLTTVPTAPVEAAHAGEHVPRCCTALTRENTPAVPAT
jgi:hypothetical protein